MLPNFLKKFGAIANRLCNGLQIRLAQFDSGSRLQTNQQLAVVGDDMKIHWDFELRLFTFELVKIPESSCLPE